MKKTLVDLFEDSVRKYPNNTFLLVTILFSALTHIAA